MARSASENATRARVSAERTECAPEVHAPPEGASVAHTEGPRLTVDQLTDDGLDALYDELAFTRADNQRMSNLFTASEKTRQRLATDADEYETQLRADLAEARAERDRARRIAVWLEQQVAAVADRHYAVSAVDHGSACDACDLPWPCDTTRALNPQEDQ